MLHNRNDLINIRNDYKVSLNMQKKKILICAGTGCIAGGSLDIYDELVRLMVDKGINCEIKLEIEPHDESVGIKKSGCHGFCEMGPLVRIEPWGYLYIKVKIEDCAEIIEKTHTDYQKDEDKDDTPHIIENLIKWCELIGSEINKLFFHD
jgi:NADH-quinone oxidoreductase subunit F